MMGIFGLFQDSIKTSAAPLGFSDAIRDYSQLSRLFLHPVAYCQVLHVSIEEESASFLAPLCHGVKMREFGAHDLHIHYWRFRYLGPSITMQQANGRFEGLGGNG